MEGLQQSLFAADSTLIQLAFTAFQESGAAIGLHLCKEVVLNLLGYDQLEIIRELALEDLLVLRTDQSLGSFLGELAHGLRPVAGRVRS